jgi:hypothetical protein
MRARNELKTLENGLGGRNRLDFGTVRPRVQIPGPRPYLYSKSPFCGSCVQPVRGAGSQFPTDVPEPMGAVVTGPGQSELVWWQSVGAFSLKPEDSQRGTVRRSTARASGRFRVRSLTCSRRPSSRRPSTVRPRSC